MNKNTQTLMYPFILKKAISSFERSSGFTSECSYMMSPRAIMVPINARLSAEEIKNCLPADEYQRLKLDEFGHFPVSQLKYSGRIGRLVGEEYERRTKKEKKIVGLQFGYEVRCNRPTAFDVILGSQLGVGAYRALAELNQNGVMVSVTGALNLSFEPFENLIDREKLRAHPRPLKPGEGFHQLARYLETRVED